jgi:hypothetical protein
VGCIPYTEEPDREPWAVSNVEGHFAVVFNGAGDSNTKVYTFSNDVYPAMRHPLARVFLEFQLTEGTAKVTINHLGTPLINTGATPGFGPSVLCDLAEGLPGIWDISIVTTNASGRLRLNIDEVMDVAANRVGFTYTCSYPTDNPVPITRNETYSWDDPGTTPVEMDLSITQFTATEDLQLGVWDGAGTPLSFDLDDGGGPISVTSPATTTGTGVEQMTSPDPFVFSAAASGLWTIWVNPLGVENGTVIVLTLKSQ